MREGKIEDLIGKTMVSVVSNNNDEIMFTSDTGDRWKLYHEQDCCEDVTIESINGDLSDLVGTPILMAEESSNNTSGNVDDYSFTWTFYNFATIHGYVTIRWYGSSNGYYSEAVDFTKVD